jgi:outer membrane lipoprotein LolB
VLEMADGGVYRAKTSNELFEQRIGWKIPVTALAWWVRGISAPGRWEMRELDEHGNLLKLSQQGWNIEYSRYRDSGGVSMPTKMTARRPPYSVKLVVQHWELQAETVPDE